MLDTRIFLVRVFPSVLEGGVRRHTGGNRFGDELAHPVSVFPLNVAEMLVEDLDDVRESVQFRFGAGNLPRSLAQALSRRPRRPARSSASPASRPGSCPCRWHRECPWRGPLSLGAGSFETRKFRNIERFSHAAVGVWKDRRQEAISSHEALGLPLERHLPVFIKVIQIDRHAGVEDGIELIALIPTQIAFHKVVDLLGRVDLEGIEFRLQVMQLVGVGLIGQNRRAIEIGEGVANGVGVGSENPARRHRASWGAPGSGARGSAPP